jgi:hypothetical protein
MWPHPAGICNMLIDRCQIELHDISLNSGIAFLENYFCFSTTGLISNLLSRNVYLPEAISWKILLNYNAQLLKYWNLKLGMFIFIYQIHCECVITYDHQHLAKTVCNVETFQKYISFPTTQPWLGPLTTFLENMFSGKPLKILHTTHRTPKSCHNWKTLEKGCSITKIPFWFSRKPLRVFHKTFVGILEKL